MTLSELSELRPALDAATSLLEELVEAHAETDFAEDGEYTDPGDFADAVLNNLAAVAYAVNAGLPVTAWSPVQKNTAESERVLRAVRQWSEQARILIEAYAAGNLTQDQLWSALYDVYVQQSTNAFTAGRRAVGNLSPLNPQAKALLAAQQQPDLARLQAAQATGGTGGGALNMLVQSIFDPTNFIGSGLPGDPQKLLMGGGEAKVAQTLATRVEQYGKSIGSMANLGEMSGLSDLPEEVVIVWWEMGDSDHCVDCIQLADLSPYLEKTLLANGLFPGSGHTQCGSNCACALSYDIPSEVCGDSMSALEQTDVVDDIGESGMADAYSAPVLTAGPFLDDNDRTRYAVWVQEADSCQMPISIGSFAGDVSAIDMLDDAEAFSWDDDIAMAMEGDVEETAMALEAALATGTLDEATWGWLSEYLGADFAAEQVSSIALTAEKITYRYAWRQTADHIVFDFGRTTGGLSTLDPELTMRALHQLGDRARAAGIPLRINAETAGPGMRKWLDAMATDRITGTPGAPSVIPKWDFIPGPGPVAVLVPLPEVSALPKLDDASKLLASTPRPMEGAGGVSVKELFTDPSGQEWIAKSGVAKQEATATAIASDMGLRVVPTSAVEGGTTSLQPILGGAKGLDALPNQAEMFHRLTPDQAAEVVDQSVLDFVLANNDAHSGQWLIDGEGRLWGVDKDASFMSMAMPHTAGTAFFASDQEYGTMIGAAFANPLKSGVLAKVSPERVAAALDRLDTYGADRMVAAAREGGVLKAIPMAFGDEAGEALLRKRIAAARDVFEQEYRKVIEGYDEALRPAEWQAWLDAGGTFKPAQVAQVDAAKLLPPIEPGLAMTTTEISALSGRLEAGYKGWFDSLTPTERKAMGEYQQDSGNALNAHLRQGESQALADVLKASIGKPTAEATIAAMDSALAKGTLPEAVVGTGGDFRTIFRGATDRHGIPEVGSTFTDPGYMSTSASSNVAVKFALQRAKVTDATPMVYRIAMPEGTKASYLDRFFDPNLGVEHELLMPRGTTFRVEAVHADVELRTGAVPVRGYVVDIIPEQAALAVPGPAVIAPTLPPVPAGPVAVVKDAAPGVGGMATKRLLTDGEGQDWLWKKPQWGGKSTTVAPKVAAEANIEGEVVVNRLAEAFGLNVTPVVPYTWDGVAGTAQRMIPDARAHIQGLYHPSVTDEQATEFMRHQVFDYMTGQIDFTQAVTAGGKLTGIDKNGAWFGLARDAISDTPAASWGKIGFNPLFSPADTALSEGGRLPISKFSPRDVAALIDRIDAMPTETYLAAVDPALRALAKIPNVPGSDKAMQSYDELVALARGRKESLRTTMGDVFRERIGTRYKPEQLPDEWRTWLDEGGSFKPAPGPAAAMPEPLALPKPPGATPLPASMRATATDISYVGTNRATWQAGFRQAKTFDEATERLGDLITGANHLGEFSLSQLNAILARVEVLDDMGFDLARVTRLDDFAKVADAQKHGRVGLTKGHTIAIRHDAKWQFFPETAIDQHPAVYDDVGGAFAHEYGHVLIADMGKDAKTALRALRDENPGVVLSDYAAEDLDEWFGEVVAKITSPGYKPGTLPYDQQVYELLDRERLLKQAELAKEPIGPPIPLEKPALGIKPGDAQQYLVGDNPLPVNAPLAEWSGLVPAEPALPAGLKPPKEEIAAAKVEADAAYMDWHDVASGKTEVSLSWGATDREAAEKAGLIYREVKTKSGGSTRFIAHDTAVADRTEAWLKVQGRSSQSDEFWTDVLGYKPEDLAAIDAYDELRRGGKRLTAGVVMVEPDGRVWVMAPKNEFAGYQNTWIKGGVDDGESAAAGAVREMREETGFSVELDSYLGDYVNTDKTGMTRMYIGHRTGGGPLGAHLKETYKMRLLDEGEAAKLLTRYGKPDARDQTILADAMKALNGEAPTTAYVIPADEVGLFTDMLKPKVYPKLGEMPTKGAGTIWDDLRGQYAINPRPVMNPAPSAAFAFDKNYIDHMGANYVEYPASSTKFPYATSKWKLPDGQEQAMYWKVEPGVAAPKAEKPGLAEALTSIKQAQPSLTAAPTSWEDLLTHVPVTGKPGSAMEIAGDAIPGSYSPWDYAVRYGPDGKPAAIAQLGINEFGGFVPVDPNAPNAAELFAAAAAAAKGPKKRELLTLEAVRTAPTQLGQGHATALYDWLQDSTDLNLYAVTGTTVTSDGKAFVTKWLQHRQQLAGQDGFGANRLFWANSKKQVADPHLRYNLHVAQLRTMLGKMEADATIGVLRVNEALLDQVPQLRELLVSAGAKKVGGFTELGAVDASALLKSLTDDTPIPAPAALVQTAPLVPVAKGVVADTGVWTSGVAELLDMANPGTIDPSLSAWHSVSWPSPAGTNKTGWFYDPVNGQGRFYWDTSQAPLGSAGDLIAAQIASAIHIIETHPDIAGVTSIMLDSKFTAGKLKELEPLLTSLDAKLMATGRYQIPIERAQAFATKLKIDMGELGADPALLKVDWHPMQPIGAASPLPAIAEAPVASYSAAGVQAGAQAAVGAPAASSKVTEALNAATDQKVVLGKAPMTQTLYPGGQATWRRLGNVLEVHGAKLDDTSGAAHLLRMAKAMDDAPKITGLRFTNAALPGFPASMDQLVMGAGGKAYVGGVKLTREQVLAIRDQLLATANATEAKAGEGLSDLAAALKGGGAERVEDEIIAVAHAFIPTLGPKYGFEGSYLATLSPTLIPQKQGFSKVVFADVAGTTIGEVRIRTLSKEIVVANVAGADQTTALIARMRMLGDDLPNLPGIERIRFDKPGILTSDATQMLFDYGATMEGTNLYLVREKALALADALDAEVKGALGQLNVPPSATVAGAVAAAPTPTSVAAPDFWDTTGLAKAEVPDLNLKVSPYSLTYSTPDGWYSAIALGLNEKMQPFPLWNQIEDWSDPKALATLEDLAKAVTSGTYPKLVITAGNVGTMPDTLEQVLSDFMAYDSNNLVLDKAGATKLVEAMAGGPLPAPVPVNPLKAGQKFSEQFNLDPDVIVAISPESQQTIVQGGFGELAEGQMGVPFEWSADMTTLTLKFDPSEPPEVGLSLIASLMDADHGALVAQQASLIVNVGSSQYVLGQPLKDILQAAGATQVGVGNSYALTFAKAKHLTESIVNDVPLRPTKLGSAVVNTPPLDPSIHDILAVHHPGLKDEDPTIWGGILSAAHSTTGPTGAVNGELTKQVIWMQGSVTANLKITATGTGPFSPFTVLTWESLGSSGPLPPETWAEVAVAQLHDLSKKLTYSATGVYSAVDTVVLDELLLATVPEVQTLALVFGGKMVGDTIVLTKDQITAIGKAIEDQIVTPPGGPGTAVAGAIEKKLEGGWTYKGAREWSAQVPSHGTAVGGTALKDASFSTGIPQPGVGDKLATYLTKGDVNDTTVPALVAVWAPSPTGMHQWISLANPHPGAALAGDDLTNASGAFLHALVVEAADAQGSVWVADSVLAGVTPEVEAMLKAAGASSMSPSSLQMGSGLWLSAEDTKGLAAKFANDGVNPLHAVSPPAVPRVGPKVLDYDPGMIASGGAAQIPVVTSPSPFQTKLSITWNAPQDASITYEKKIGTLAQVKSFDLPFSTVAPDNTVAALVSQLLSHAKAEGLMPYFDKAVYDAHPGLKGTLLDIGFLGGDPSATAMTILPENIDAAGQKLLGMTSPAQASTLLDPLLTGVGPGATPGLKAYIGGQVTASLPLITDTPMAQGFGKLSNGALDTKYRRSTTALTVKTSSGYPLIAEQLTTLMKVAEMVEGDSLLATVKFEQAWLTKNDLVKQLLAGQGATAVGDDLVFDRYTYLKLRDAVSADLKGLPAPVGSAAPVASAAPLAATIGAPTPYDVQKLAGLGPGDMVAYDNAFTHANGLVGPKVYMEATEYNGTLVGHWPDEASVAGPETATEMVIYNKLFKAGPDPKESVLAMLAARGTDVEVGDETAIFVADELLDAVPGLKRVLGPFGEPLTLQTSLGDELPGLYLNKAHASDVINHLYQGIPLVSPKTAAAIVPPLVVTEPLATKLGWDLSKVADFESMPQMGYLGGKERTLNWHDITAKQPDASTGWVPLPGADHTFVRQRYQDYAKHLVYEGDLQHYAGPATDAQRTAALWKSMQWLGDSAAGSSRPLFVTSAAITEHPELGKLLDLYGAGPEKKFMSYVGRDLTPAQAKQMAEDLAANAPVTGIASPSVTAAAKHPGKVFDPISGGWIDPAQVAMPLPPKSAAQIAADYQAELVSTNKVGSKGVTVAGEESFQSQVFGDIDSGTASYWTPPPPGSSIKIEAATMQWTSGGWGKPLSIEDITGITGSVEVKAAMADAAVTADVSGGALLIDDSVIAKLEVDDMGGLLYWSPANDAWTTSQPGKFADYLLGKQKPPVGQALVKPVAVAAPPPVSVIAKAISAPPTGLDAVYGFTHADAKALADDLTGKVKVAILNDTPLTKTYESTWANGAAVKWAEEQQGDARILRVRATTAGTKAQKADAIVAGLMAEWPAYLGTHADVARVLINKSALADTPALADMLKAAGWKETKEYFVLGRDGVGELATHLSANTSEWMAQATIPTSVPAGGWSGALPTKPSPSFIYDYNPVTHQKLYGAIVDKDIGALDLGGGVGQGHELTIGKVKVTWSVSPSGNTVGIGKLEVEASATNAERVDDMMAALQYVAEQMQGRTGNLWIKPDLYQHVPGLSQVLKDAGAVEAQFGKLGDAIQMNASQAGVLAKALQTDDMAGLTISISTSSDYLGYNGLLAGALYGKEPIDLGKGVLRYETGATGAAKTAEAHISLSSDGKSGVLREVKADASVSTITVAAQVNWFVTHGATDVLISSDVLAMVPKLDKYLASLGGHIEAGGIRLTDKALYNTRAALTKNLLPVPLGGDPAKFAFNITDSMVAAESEVMDAVHSELVAEVGAKSVSTYIVGGRKIAITHMRSNGNIFWDSITRGDASIGQARSASVAQLRTFVNDMAQNASLVRLDVGLDVLADQPGLREVLKRYGAKEVAATPGHPAFLSLERPKAMKLRLDIEKELGATTPGTSATFIGQQAALIKWPTADEMTEVAGAAAKLGGQTEKAVFRDAAGNEWMFKPGASGQGAAADKAAAEVAQLMGLPVPPVRIYTLEVNGKLVQGSLQKMIPGGHEINPSLASLTPKDHQALWEHSALDWVIANDDAHIHNWLVDADGHIWGVDKTRAWKAFGDPHRDVLDVNSLGQGGSEAMAPTFFKWWKEAKRNPALLQQVHPMTITKPLRELRAVDDATYRSIVTPLAKIAAKSNSKYKGDWARMVEDMVARKNSAANDLEAFMSKQLTEMKRAGTALPADWDAWLRGGGKLNLDATPQDLMIERATAHEAKFSVTSPADAMRRVENDPKFGKLRGMMHSGYGGGYHGGSAGAGAVQFGAGHAGGGSGYGYEKVRPTLRSTPAGAAVVEEWEALNEIVIIHALTDKDTSWLGGASSWATRMRKWYNADTGTVRMIRSTQGYGKSAQAALTGYTRDGFRNLLSFALDNVTTVGGHNVLLYADVEPRQFFTSMFGGFASGEAEVAVADLRIDQIKMIRQYGGYSSGLNYTDAASIMAYNGPVVSVK